MRPLETLRSRAADPEQVLWSGVVVRLNIPLSKQMGAMGKLEEIQRQQKEEQVQVVIQAEIEFEAQLDAMNEDEANAYAR